MEICGRKLEGHLLPALVLQVEMLGREMIDSYELILLSIIMLL